VYTNKGDSRRIQKKCEVGRWIDIKEKEEILIPVQTHSWWQYVCALSVCLQTVNILIEVVEEDIENIKIEIVLNGTVHAIT
jgi:hypothetical protein